MQNARESDDIETYNQILNQLQQQFSDRFVGTPINENDQVLIPIDKEPITTSSLPIGTEWTDELEIFNGQIGTSTGGNPTPNRKMVKLIADTLVIFMLPALPIGVLLILWHFLSPLIKDSPGQILSIFMPGLD